MTQRCYKCGRRIERDEENRNFPEEKDSSAVIALVEVHLVDAFMEKISKLDSRYYCQDCGVLVKTILENWEGQ